MKIIYVILILNCMLLFFLSLLNKRWVLTLCYIRSSEMNVDVTTILRAYAK
jgi:hypothetical protein